jgi:hypothetical protein
VTIQPSLDRIVLVLYHIIPILTTTRHFSPPSYVIITISHFLSLL